MSFDFSGTDAKSNPQSVVIFVPAEHPLLLLANAMDWRKLWELAEPDLKKTAKGFWFLGRKLKIRTHLGVYLLQQMLNKTDRAIERDLLDNAAFRVFCGLGSVEGWRVPDHTKIEEFRSRLSPETQRRLANHLAQQGVRLGHGDPSAMDMDSTVQDANMAYPSDANLMVKLVAKARKVLDFMLPHLGIFQPSFPGRIDLKACKAKLREYFFGCKRSCPDTKKRVFTELHDIVCAEMAKIAQIHVTPQCVARLPWNIRRAWLQIEMHMSSYLRDVRTFIDTNEMAASKITSFHLSEVACFNKGKLDKSLQFGRAFQLGRIGGNFLMALAARDVRMEDKRSVKPMVEEHAKLFGDDVLKSFGTDKGYYSKANENFLKKRAGLECTALQRPGVTPQLSTEAELESFQRLVDRRAGIEALIGHAKQGGQLGRSRMKSDQATLSAGFAAILGFNARQLIRHLRAEEIAPMLLG